MKRLFPLSLMILVLVMLTLALIGPTAHAEGPGPVFHTLPHGTPVPFKPGYDDNGARCDRMCIDPYELDHDTCTCALPDEADKTGTGIDFPEFPVHDGLIRIPVPFKFPGFPTPPWHRIGFLF